MPSAVVGRTRSRRLHPVTGLVVLAAAAALALGGNPNGLLVGETLFDAVGGVIVGFAVVLVWLAAGAPYAFVVGQIGLVVGLDGGLTSTPVIQILLIAVVLVDVLVWRDPRSLLATSLASAIAAIGLVALVYVGTGVVTTVAPVVVATGLVVYTIHRYERLALELVGDAS